MKISAHIIKQFEKHLIEQEKSDATIEKYIRDVKSLAKYLNGENVEKAKILAYKNSLVDTYAPASVNSIIASLNCFFDFCTTPEMKLKALKLQRKMFSNKEKELSKAEYERLLKAAKDKHNKRLYYLMQTICSTGIRVSEVRFVTTSAVKAGCVKINSKGKLRTCFLPKELCRILSKYIKEEKIQSGSVFVTKSGKPLDRSNIWHDMKSLCHAAGVDRQKVFPHNLRHLFARTYYTIEKDIVRLADILGHSSVNTTRIYTMEAGDVHRRQIERLGLLKC